MSLSDALHDAACQSVRTEIGLLEQMIAAFVAETGQMPTVWNHSVTGRQWLQVDPGGDIVRAAGQGPRLTEFAARYHLQTDVPASEAVLVRDLDGAGISWRFERRAL